MTNSRAETIAKSSLGCGRPNLMPGEMRAYHELMLKLLTEDRRARYFDGKLRLHGAEARILAILATLKFGARTGEDTWELVLPTEMAWATERRYGLSCAPGKSGCTVITATKKTPKLPSDSREEVALGGGCSNLTGKRFGMLVALRPVSRAKNGSVTWLFRCDCGTEFVAVGSNVVSGRTKSCGCLRSARARARMLQKWRDKADA